MRYMQKWEPMKDLWNISDELNDFFFGTGRTRKGEEEGLVNWIPSTDLYEDENSFKIYVDLPGMKKEDISINVTDGVLTVKGERKFEEKEEDKKNYFRVERSYGSFRRSFTLPNNVDEEKVSASMKDGILTVEIAKPEEKKPKQIEIH